MIARRVVHFIKKNFPCLIDSAEFCVLEPVKMLQIGDFSLSSKEFRMRVQFCQWCDSVSYYM